jgi:nitrate/TMAO reductase-like tetraheme cytochrome c subunit
MRIGVAWSIVLSSALLSSVAAAADSAAGKSSVEAKCVQCHQPADWTGETQASLESLIRDVVAGAVSHPQKVPLGEAEITNIAAYWVTSAKSVKRR